MYTSIGFTFPLKMSADIELYDEETGKQVKLNNFGVTEDLALVEYMFCDKTGTLTKN